MATDKKVRLAGGGFSPTVLLIDPSEAGRVKGAASLDALGVQPRLAGDVFEALGLVEGSVAVVAAHPAAAGIYPRLRSAGIPLIAALLAKTERPASLARKIGADAYVLRPYKRETLGIALHSALNARLLRERAQRAEAALAEATGSADKDGGMLHADLFRTLLPLEIRRARRHGYPIGLCVVHLDVPPGLKAVPAELAAECEPSVRSAVRDVDLAVRYGAGRFLVFLPHTDARGAEVVGNRIQTELRNVTFKSGERAGVVTASIGIATPRSGKAVSFAKLIRDAHAAVRAAQLKGGDRVILR